MNSDLQTTMEAILFEHGQRPALGGTDFAAVTGSSEAEALQNAALRLVGRGGPGTGTDFLSVAVERTLAELSKRIEVDSAFSKALRDAAEVLRSDSGSDWNDRTREALWSVFFPEGVGLEQNREAAITALRERRIVSVDSLNPSPIADPAREILFTSNVLITVPGDAADLEPLTLDTTLKERIRATMEEVQLYYYDHPIHIGVATDNNEAIYGMRGLDRAIAWEKQTGRIDADARATVILSLSVTHASLHTVARDYLKAEFLAGGPFEHLNIYLFTEIECRRIVSDVLAPWIASRSTDDSATGEAGEADDTLTAIESVFGVDGEYGRHYSFLKAIAAFWQVFIDPKVRGTFKIDLDQIFPQNELAEETGESALDHFRTPLWGSQGRDSEGTPVELGMIAGALVNEKDIDRGLFTPDVPFPDTIPAGEAVVFYNKLPMALSTQAEMMTRYRVPDGDGTCIMRYHVTGGTNGILVDSLRRHRPFTPSFVGRAEDQAYILSVLYARRDKAVLRYVHKPGLIMRHDKEAFAGESIKAATHGRFVGDLARTWIFSRYVEALPWSMDQTKAQIDPFTGCFATSIPTTIMTLRLLLYCGALIAANNDGSTDNQDAGPAQVALVLDVAERKLSELWEAAPDAIAVEYRRQRDAWDSYYDALDRADRAQRPDQTNDQARRSTAAAAAIVEDARLV